MKLATVTFEMCLYIKSDELDILRRLSLQKIHYSVKMSQYIIVIIIKNLGYIIFSKWFAGVVSFYDTNERNGIRVCIL